MNTLSTALTPDDRARRRASEAIARLGLLADEPLRREKLLAKSEVFLWRFMVLRWYDAHRFFQSVESKEMRGLIAEGFAPGRMFRFFLERQDAVEFENSVVVGLSLVFAAMRKSAERNHDPREASLFTLQRMMEQSLEGVDDLVDLLAVGAPPSAAALD
jgi:hypothetical protein